MKEKQAFTPGPWSQGTVGEGSHATNVVWLGETDKRIEVANRDNDEANARLIAAAPDMYKLLSKISNSDLGDVETAIQITLDSREILAKVERNREKLPVYASVDAYAGHLFGRGEG